MVDNQLTICILDKGNTEYLSGCVKDALKISPEVFYIDLESDDQSNSKARELGVQVVDFNSLTSVLTSEWVLFIKPEERPVVSSPEKFKKELENKQAQGYGIYTKNLKVRPLIEEYQWVIKLEQFKNAGDSAYVSTIEPRLLRRSLAKKGLEYLAAGNADELSWVCGNIAKGIMFESITDEKPDNEEEIRDHDIRCLKGELVYDVTAEEDMVELSEMYTGFRILTRDQLDGFMEGARRGFGHYKMYIPMLDFLCKDGFYREAKQLFETWNKNRPDVKDDYNTQLMGGMIYTNLLELDKAIEWFKKIIEKSESALAFATLGKLYLIKGEKNKAIKYLKMSSDIQGDIFLKKRILSIIDNKEWRPLKLSLCMIARDEEDQIGKALQSVDGLVDEIIVVDTGSTDKTMEIIKKFGGKLIESEWEDDFSQARNLALHEVTGDYILFMDADEFIHPTDRFGFALFKMLLPMEKNNAFGFKIEPAKEARKMSMAQSDLLTDQKEDDYQIRMFPKKTGIQFQGKIFESLDETLNEKQVQALRYDVFKITHSMEEREKRDGRKISAITKSFDTIYDPLKILKAGILFLRLGDLENAYPWLVKAAGVDPILSAKIGMIYSRQNKLEMAKDILAGALKQLPDSLELILSMAEVYYKEANYNEVINILANRIEVIDKNLESEDAARALYYHGIASLETGSLGDGIEYLAFAHEKNPADILYKIAGIYAFSKVEQWEEALNAAGRITDEEGIKISVPEVNDFVDVGQVFVEMNRYFAQAGKIEEANLCQMTVEDIVKTKISGEENIQRMSTIIEGIGETFTGDHK